MAIRDPEKWAGLLKQLGNLGMGFAALMFAFALLAYTEYNQAPIERDRVEAMGKLAAAIKQSNEQANATDRQFLQLLADWRKTMDSRLEVDLEILRELKNR